MREVTRYNRPTVNRYFCAVLIITHFVQFPRCMKILRERKNSNAHQNLTMQECLPAIGVLRSTNANISAFTVLGITLLFTFSQGLDCTSITLLY